MRPLAKPTDTNSEELTARDTYTACISIVRDRALKARLELVAPDVERLAMEYDRLSVDQRRYELTPHLGLGAVTSDEFVAVYETRMVRRNTPGRKIYDLILSGANHRKCPFCGLGTASTLDHFLPKRRFPALSVTPSNLVPSCVWCQGNKAEYFGTTKDQQLLHPYFDNFEDQIWLGCEVIESNPAGFRYFPLEPAAWDATKHSRVAAHFRELELGALFSANAGSRLAEIRLRLSDLYLSGGEDAVRSHLEADLVSSEADSRNSWVSAMYRSAVDSAWFCNGGFEGE